MLFIVGHKDDPRGGAPLLWRQAGRVGAGQAGEAKALGRTHCSPIVFKGL